MTNIQNYHRQDAYTDTDESGSSEGFAVKIGTNVLLDDHGRLDKGRVRRLVRDLVAVQKSLDTRNCALVVSGAITAGLAAYGRKRNGPLSIAEKQLYASAGLELYWVIQQELQKQERVMNLMLLTRQNFRDTVERQNILTMLQSVQTDEKIGIPVINEDDVVAVEELTKFGDNDLLLEEIVKLLGIKQAVNLTSKNGILQDVEEENSTIPEISCDDMTVDTVISNGHRSENGNGMGNAGTKLESGKRLAKERSVTYHIANGRDTCAMLQRILLDGKKGEGEYNWTTIFPNTSS